MEVEGGLKMLSVSLSWYRVLCPGTMCYGSAWRVILSWWSVVIVPSLHSIAFLLLVISCEYKQIMEVIRWSSFWRLQQIWINRKESCFGWAGFTTSCCLRLLSDVSELL